MKVLECCLALGLFTLGGQASSWSAPTTETPLPGPTKPLAGFSFCPGRAYRAEAYDRS